VKVLLVEDHDDVAEMMLVMLDMLGHEAILAKTVASAVRLAGAEKFDVVLVDYSLPDGTGDQVIRQIPGCNAILLTAYNHSFLDSKLAGLNVQFRQKPVDMADLDVAIRQAVAT
jgi:DNA-binding response OmpR family regulator